MTNSTKYWIWLNNAIGNNNPKHKRIFEMYDSIEEFYNLSEYEKRLSGLFSDNEITKLQNTDLKDSFDIISKCNENNISILCFDDVSYPKKLFDIYAPPSVLYVSGVIPDFDNLLSIGMVGTRNATSYGVMASHIISGSLAKLSVVIVSGGALGIDTACHKGALEAGGTTVCVLGCGIDFPYLMQNATLRKDISKSGAVITEYPPGTPSTAYRFPERNRIISGLSDGVCVVEADLKSGSLITANCALTENRDVFAVMGNITSRYSEGTNNLIKDGAIPVMSFKDIIDCYPEYKIECNEKVSSVIDEPKHRKDINVSNGAKAVYYAITATPVHIDKIAETTKLPVNIVLQAVTELELFGLIEAGRGRMYKLI